MYVCMCVCMCVCVYVCLCVCVMRRHIYFRMYHNRNTEVIVNFEPMRG